MNSCKNSILLPQQNETTSCLIFSVVEKSNKNNDKGRIKFAKGKKEQLKSMLK